MSKKAPQRNQTLLPISNTAKKLKELVKAGKLRAMGAKNVRFYIKNRS